MTKLSGPQKLRRLANFLAWKVTDEQYDQENWMSQCGTTGCAMGWGGTAMSDQLGFEFIRNPKSGEAAFKVEGVEDPISVWDYTDVASIVFGVDEDTAEYLFGSTDWDEEDEVGDGGRTRCEQVRRLRAVADRLEKQLEEA